MRGAPVDLMTRRLLNVGAYGAVPPSAVYIGRGTLLGNPYRIGPDGTRDEVIAKYEAYFQRMLRQPGFVTRVLSYVGDYDLACWCAPKPCHGEIVLRWLESLEQPSERD